MKQNHSTRILAMLLALVMILTTAPLSATAARAATNPLGGVAVAAVNDPEQGVIYVPAEVKQENSEEVTILVGVAEDTVYMQTGDLQLAANGFDSQMALYARTEAKIESALASQIEVETRYSLLFNGFSFVGEKWMIDAINQIDGLVAIEDITFELVEAVPAEETVTISPMLSNSTGNTAANGAWAQGYTGEGMVVAIIDSGILKTHEAFSVEPENAKITKDYLRDVYAQYGDKMHGGNSLQINNVYYNAKLPFCWDYIEQDGDPQHTATDHGTHVAGIAAGNNGSDFKGVAPDAQIIPMGVFDANGGATFTTLMAAMEDCVFLGVDAINMSLGVTAFFSAYESLDAYMETVYAALEDAGIAVAAAAGNDTTASVWNNYSIYYDKAGTNGMWSMMNLDNGVVGAPATFPGSLSVASVNNDVAVFGAFELTYGGVVYDVESYPDTSLTDLSGTYELVWCGTATTDHMAQLEAAGISLEGKIALCSRNDILYDEKCSNVAAAGAVACIIMNSIPNNNYRPEFKNSIPCGLMTNGVGEALLNNMNGSKGVYYGELPLGLSGSVTCAKESNYNLLTPSTFSSWGTTAGLEIKPEIAAPGGGITSAIGFATNASYAAWDGTSMATPHVAGGMLLVKQALREKYPDATAAEINDLAHNYIMSTAHGIDNVFVRRQGAGMIDLAAAVSSSCYATVDGGRPKLELDDSEYGAFTMQFEVHNDGNADETFRIDLHIMTMGMQDLEFSGYRENYGYNEEAYREYNQKYHYFLSNDKAVNVKVTQGHTFEVTDQCTVVGPTTITVAAGETKNVMLEVSCNDSLLRYLEANAPAGNYLEGFVRLTPTAAPAEDGGRSILLSAGGSNAVPLSIPFLGFVGDWDYVPMFDDGFWWQIPYGQTNLAQSTEAQGTFVGYGTMNQGLGMNLYGSMKGKTYKQERNAISPNGDGILDAVDSLSFALMRNPKNLKVYLTDENGNVLETFFDEDYWYRKEFYTAGLNGGTSFSAMEIAYDWSQLAENQTVNLVMEAWLDHEEYEVEDNFNGRMVFPITIDTTAPKIIPEFYQPTETVNMGLNVVDDNFVSYYAVYADADFTEVLYENTFFSDYRNNWECSFNNEWNSTDYRTEYYVFAADYAGNETLVKCTYEGKLLGPVPELDPSTCPASVAYQSREIIGRQMLNWNTGNWEYAFVKTNTACSSQNELLTEVTYSNPTYDAGFGYDFTAAAVRYDGTLFVNSFRNLAILNPETYEVTFVAQMYSDGVLYDPSVRAIMSHPDSGELYAFAYLCYEDSDGEFYCKVDSETGELTPLWEIQDYVPQAADVWNFGYAYIDADTVAIFGHNGYVWLVSEDTGDLIREIQIMEYAPSGESQFGIHATGANMLYDETTNTLHIYCRWAWFRYNRYNTGGHLTVNLDTEEVTYHSDGAGMGYLVYGLYFADEVVAKSWYPVIALIDAIADAETLEEMKAAIDAAREAYEALPETDKDYINNYQELLDAEAEYENLLSGLEVARQSALDTIALLRGAPEGYYKHQVEDYEDALNAAEEALKGAKSVVEINRILADLEQTLAAIAVSCPAQNFVDVNDDDWWHAAVDYVVNAGYMNGMDATHFGSALTMSRAQFVTVLYRMEGEPEVNNTGIFTDVPADQFYTEAAYWALEKGITTGATTTTFNPGGQLTRTELVTFMYRYAAYKGHDISTGDLSAYRDADQILPFARNAWSWAVNHGVITGMTADTLAPMNLTNRAQAAVIFQRFDSAR